MAADGRRDDEELPVYLARPSSAAAPRPKRGGLFCNVEGAFESKTLDFGALRVGQRRAPPPTGPDPPPGAAPGPGQTADGLRATSGEERRSAPALEEPLVVLRWLLRPGCPQLPRRPRGEAPSRPCPVRGAPPAERDVGGLAAAPAQSESPLGLLQELFYTFMKE